MCNNSTSFAIWYYDIHLYILFHLYTHLIRKYITIDIEDKYTDCIICTCIYIERKDG